MNNKFSRPSKFLMGFVFVVIFATGFLLSSKKFENWSITFAYWSLAISYFFPLFLAMDSKDQWVLEKEYKCFNNIIYEANKYSFSIDNYIRSGEGFDSLINVNKIELLATLKSNINDIENIKANFLSKDYNDSQKDMDKINCYYRELKRYLCKLSKDNSTRQTYIILKDIEFLICKIVDNCNQQISNSRFIKSRA